MRAKSKGCGGMNVQQDFHHGCRHSVTSAATRYPGWTVRGSNPGGGEVYHTLPNRPWGPSSLLYNGYWVSFPGFKRPGRGVDHPPPSSAKVVYGWGYTSASP